MATPANRRQFLRTATIGGLVGLSDLDFLGGLPPVSAREARLDGQVVQLHPEIEPLVRLLEETSRDRLLEQVADRIRKGCRTGRCSRP